MGTMPKIEDKRIRRTVKLMKEAYRLSREGRLQVGRHGEFRAFQAYAQALGEFTEFSAKQWEEWVEEGYAPTPSKRKKTLGP
jgi:hypothetical protein